MTEQRETSKSFSWLLLVLRICTDDLSPNSPARLYWLRPSSQTFRPIELWGIRLSRTRPVRLCCVAILCSVRAFANPYSDGCLCAALVQPSATTFGWCLRRHYPTGAQHRPHTKVVGEDMTYVNVVHPLFILGWLHARERLYRLHGRTKVANRLAFAVVPSLRRHHSHSCLPTKPHNSRRYTNGELKRLEGRNPRRERL